MSAKIGFNWGQMFSYIAFKNGYQGDIPSKLFQKIKKVAPNDWIENARFSGTLSNYMNIHELGYGEHKETFQQWLPFSKRVNILQKVQFLLATLTGDDKKIINMSERFVMHSYLINFANTCKQLGVKDVSFTFNSHSPFRGFCTLEKSLDSLRYIKDNTPLKAIELENEGYFAEYIWRERLDEYFDFLESEVVPNIIKIVGKDFPLGIPIAPDNITPRYKRWNNKAIKLYESLKAKGHNPFFVVHAYINNVDKKGIEFELTSLIDFLPKGAEIKITEFNLRSDSKNRDKLKKQENTIDFISIFAEVAKEMGIKEVYYHSLLTSEGVHFSFIK